MAKLELDSQVQKLCAAIRNVQAENRSRPPSVKDSVLSEADTSTDRSLMAPLVGEHSSHVEDTSDQLHFCQAEIGEMRLKLESIMQENEKLHRQLREFVEKQVESLPAGSDLGSDQHPEEEMIRNLQEQLHLANQEKEHALELWQTVAQELDRLQQLYQEHMTEAQIHVAEKQKQNDHLIGFQQMTKQLQETNEQVESTNKQFLQTVTEQNLEIEQLRKQLRQAKLDLRVATVKVEDMTKLVENLQEQMQRKEEDMVAVQGREEASDRRLQQLQSAITQLETRLRVAAQDAEQVGGERTGLEKQVGELQAKCADLEEERYEAVVRVRDSMQLVEEANLQKDQALLRERQKEAEIEQMKEAMGQLIQEAAARTRKEVETARKHYNVQISRLTEDLSALQMDCSDKQSQIERAVREKRAAEEELEKLYREGRGNEGNHRKLEELHQRCLMAERTKDDLQISLQTAHNKIRQLEINSEEEMSRCQEMIRKLHSALESERENCGTVSDERLKLLQENEQLKKEMAEWKKAAGEAQLKAKFQISTMEHEYSVKEQTFEVQLTELEESSRNSTNELRRLLVAQQKATSRWKEEAKKLTENAETRLKNLRSELNQQKHRTQELASQLEAANEKLLEYEKLTTEYQEKTSRLQRRLDQAEQRATSAAHQINQIAKQKRKAATVLDLENV
ncbi:sodium channel and clathrin linker 1 isoform X2 [Rhinatrema bivittatum]|uniref:sodium channel and clathrin linker 1 isoform X2 n=1 Tax=Rhinatrema bivittatum TaxID=194408 RepID=UPI00112D89C4|nr:sodium channel and clathrin linker 1 isoform X2 [Rhinatrema bivittatum]